MRSHHVGVVAGALGAQPLVIGLGDGTSTVPVTAIGLSLASLDKYMIRVACALFTVDGS